MLSNTSKKNISKLQKVQNFACRIITGKRKFDHVTPVLRELRWLPVTSFLKCTLGVSLAFKCVKVGTHDGTNPSNKSQGLVASCDLAIFATKSSRRDQDLVPATSPTNSNWFDFLGLVAGAKVGPCD